MYIHTYGTVCMGRKKKRETIFVRVEKERPSRVIRRFGPLERLAPDSSRTTNGAAPFLAAPFQKERTSFLSALRQYSRPNDLADLTNYYEICLEKIDQSSFFS